MRLLVNVEYSQLAPIELEADDTVTILRDVSEDLEDKGIYGFAIFNNAVYAFTFDEWNKHRMGTKIWSAPMKRKPRARRKHEPAAVLATQLYMPAPV